MNRMKTIQKISCTYAKNEPFMKRNDAVLNDLSDDLHTVGADDKYPMATIQAAELKTSKYRRFSKVA